LGRKPLLVKIAPDLNWPALDELLSVCLDQKIDGLIATNTTITKEGGLSGKPLFPKSLAAVTYIRQHLPRMPIIGVGGIFTPEDAAKMFEAGADLIQVYTGLIYQGPFLAKTINKGLLEKHLL